MYASARRLRVDCRTVLHYNSIEFQKSTTLHEVDKMAETRSRNSSHSSSGAESAEIDYDEDEPDFSDSEDYVDDVSDEQLLGDLLKSRPKETDGLDNVIVVDGVPRVGPERLEKLQLVIRKLFANYGKVANEYYPDENGQTKGFVFMEYGTHANALESLQLDGHKLDKQHVLSVNLLSDFDKYLSIPDEWVPPQPTQYKDLGNVTNWLQDPDCYDQYSVMYDGGKKTAIYSNSMPEATLVEEREGWTETYVRWSPLGTFLATFHTRGVALWGGEKFTQLMKFNHTDVQYIDFSPCEKYLVTFSPSPDTRDDPQSIVIWDTRTGVRKRNFPSDRSGQWPVFKWSHDDKFFAKIVPNEAISVYETPSFGLWEKKSVQVDGIRDFSWSPSENVIAYWVGENKDVPARVCLLEIPGRGEYRTKNLFSVADCKMHWQKSGDYLCVKVDRYSKSKKEKSEKSAKTDTKYSGLYHNLEIFHMREKEIPVDSIEIKEPIVAFAWEPIGTKFCFIHGDSPNIMVSFFDAKVGATAVPIKKLERRQCNHIFWAPQGQFVLLAGLRSMSGALDFIDTSDMTVMCQAEHEFATDIEWDPTGRYVVTGVSFWMQKVDTGFNLWSFQGKLLQTHSTDRFCQLLWRPRPPSLLTADQIKELRKNLKKYSAQFEIKDRQALTKASKEIIEKRRVLLQAFEDYRSKRRLEYEETKWRRLELRDDIDTDELDSHMENMEEEIVEFFVREELIELDE